VWDRDQDVADDFEGMAILDISTIEGDVTEKWIPLVGRSEDEKVTGDINVVITRGPLEEVSLLLFCFLLSFLIFIISCVFLKVRI